MLYSTLNPVERRLLARLFVLRRVPRSPINALFLMGRLNSDLERWGELEGDRWQGLSVLFGGRPIGLTKVLDGLVEDGLIVRVINGLDAGSVFERRPAADALESDAERISPVLGAALEEIPLDSRVLLDTLARE